MLIQGSVRERRREKRKIRRLDPSPAPPGKGEKRSSHSSFISGWSANINRKREGGEKRGLRDVNSHWLEVLGRERKKT